MIEELMQLISTWSLDMSSMLFTKKLMHSFTSRSIFRKSADIRIETTFF